VAAELWKKLEPEDAGRGSLLLSLGVGHLRESRWAAARGLSYFVINDNKLEEALRLSGRVNYWQSFKWAGDYATIKEEVDKFDFSAKSPLFQLAHAAIRDDFEAFFRMLPGLLEDGKLKKVELATWPLFTTVRERPEFEPYRAQVQDVPQSLEVTGDEDRPLPSNSTVN
jgi:hypothetical protein